MNTQTTCCPEFQPAPWDETAEDFSDKLFLKDHVRSLFHIPLNYGAVMKRDLAMIKEAGALETQQIILTDEKSLWGSDVYTQTTKIIPDAQMCKINGQFESKVFVGPYSKMGQFVSEMKAYLSAKGSTMNGVLFYYPHCPKCAKKYGKNYIVILAAKNGADLDFQDL